MTVYHYGWTKYSYPRLMKINKQSFFLFLNFFVFIVIFWVLLSPIQFILSLSYRDILAARKVGVL